MSNIGTRNTYHLVPEPVSGYVLDPAEGYFSIILPEAGLNYATNPSAEINDTGYTSYLGSTVARVTTRARRGIYSIRCTPSAQKYSGVQYVGSAIPAGLSVSVSVDVWAATGIPIRVMALFGVTWLPVAKTIGKGRWERLSGGVGIGVGVPTVVVQKNNSFSVTPFYIDGVQIEANSYPTTYIDGDQVGYQKEGGDYWWIGAPHQSLSRRSSKCRAGGKVVPLKDLGLDVMSIVNLGMASAVPDVMEFGTLDGGEYHDTHTPPRVFTITGAMFGRNKGELATKRKAIIDALKPDLVLPKQPSVLRYQFGTKCNRDGLVLEIPCVITEGLSGQFDNHHQERIALSLNAPWPYLLEDGNDSKLLDDIDSTDSDAWAMRDYTGLWHNFASCTDGGGAAAIRTIINSKAVYTGGGQMNGGWFFGGDVDTVGGSGTGHLFYFDRYSETFTLFAMGANSTVHALHETPNGTLYVGGAFTSFNGNLRNRICYMHADLVDHDLAGGADGTILSIATTYNGDIYIGGEFANVGTGGGAVAAAYIAMYDVSAAVWVNLCPGGDPDGRVNKILVGPDGKIYVCGGFANLNGIVCNHVAVYDPATATWDNLGAGMSGGNCLDICFGLDGRLYGCGSFTSPAYAAVFNGNAWEYLGAGIQNTVIGTTIINKCTCGPDGRIWFAGDFAINAPFAVYNCEYASWDGSCFGFLDGQPPVQADEQACDGLAICVSDANELVVSFDEATATPGARFYCGQPQTVTNQGSAIAHPVLTVSITGGLYSHLYIRNLTTGHEIRFALIMDDGGRFWVDMTPGKIRTYSNYHPVEQMLFDGSDMATFELAPGANRIIVYSNRSSAGTVAIVGLYWRNNEWGADDGVA